MSTDDRNAPESHPAIAPPPARIETGPVQFGDDWPGLFLRGDDALAYARALTAALEALRGSPDLSVAMRATLGGLADRLAVPKEVPSDGQRLRPFGDCLPRVGIPRSSAVPPPVHAEASPDARLAEARENLRASLACCEGLYEVALDLATLVLRGERVEAEEAAREFVNLEPPPAVPIESITEGGRPPWTGWFWRALASAAVRDLVATPEAPNYLTTAVNVKVPPQAPAYAGETLRVSVTAHRPGGHTILETLVQLRVALAAIAAEDGIPAEGRAALRALREANPAPSTRDLAGALAESLAPLPTPGLEHAA